MEKAFSKKDFEELNKLKLYGKLCDGVDTELYWFNTIDRADAAFGQTMKTHHHEFFEIHFILGGRIVYVFGQDRAEAVANSVVVIPAGVPHMIDSFTSDMLKSSVAVRINGGEAIFKGLCAKGCMALKLQDAICDGIAFCADTAGRQLPYKETLIKNRIFEILCDIAGEFDFTSQKISPEADARDLRLFKAKQFIKDNPNVFIGCEELARYCNISAKQLNRIFLKFENKPLLQYIHAEKIDQAKKMLTESDATVSDISETLGFSSVYYFSRFFTKHIGVSPAEYRKAAEDI